MHVTNYFLISSPLHFFIATNLAITHSGDKNIAIFISKKNAEQYSNATKHFSHIFQYTFDFSLTDKNNNINTRKHCLIKIKQLISSHAPSNIFTGNDRRAEFQYAMHQAKKSNIHVKGIYMDDGVISYLGHKSINKFTHKYLEPLVKKITYGLWWDTPLTTGTSKWISSAYLTFPHLAHPLLKHKKLIALNQDVFSSAQFLQLNQFLTTNCTELKNVRFSQLKTILCLPHESFYLTNKESIIKIKKALNNKFKTHEIAIKAHPRSKDIKFLEDMFPDCVFLPSTIGMELLLPKLNKSTCILGDISTTLLTAKWLRPELTVQSFELNSNASKKIKVLFDNIGIQSFN